MSSAQDQPVSGTGTDAAAGTSGTATGTPVATGAPMGKHASPTAEAERGYVPRQASGYDDRPGLVESNASGAVIGWTVFAAVMLMIAGIGNVLDGIAPRARVALFTTVPLCAYNLAA